MIKRPHLWALAAATALVAACTSPPESGKQDQPKGPQFDADYYSKNAKEYYGAGRYGQAKDQWQKQLQKDPDNWMAQLGIAYSDYFLSAEFESRGDLASARKQLEASEKRFRDLWNGTVESDTATADPKRRQWQAAIGLAMAVRGLGALDQNETRSAEASLRKGGKEAATAANRVAELQLDRERRYEESLQLFKQLAYMQHASPEAIKNLGDLYIVTKQDALAEVEFKRYLDMASNTRGDWEVRRKEAGTTYGPDQQEMAEKVIDEKLESNARKQVSVMMNLAHLAWARGDYEGARKLLEDAIKIEPERRDLYLKLAEAENKLDMLETGLVHVNDYLKRSSSNKAGFDDDIRVAMKLKTEIEGKMKARAK